MKLFDLGLIIMYRNSRVTIDYDSYIESEYKLGAHKDWMGGSDKVLSKYLPGDRVTDNYVKGIFEGTVMSVIETSVGYSYKIVSMDGGEIKIWIVDESLVCLHPSEWDFLF